MNFTYRNISLFFNSLADLSCDLSIDLTIEFLVCLTEFELLELEIHFKCTILSFDDLSKLNVIFVHNMKQSDSHWSCQGLVSLIPGTARPNTFNLYLRIPDLLNDLMWRTKYMLVATWVFQWIFRTPVLCYSRSVIIAMKKLFNNVRIQFTLLILRWPRSLHYGV